MADVFAKETIEDSIFHASEKMKVKMAVLFLRMTQEKERM